MRICMLLHKSVEHDSRVRREAKALARAGHDVTVVHLPRRPRELDGELDGFRVVSATPPPWVRERIPFALYRLVFLIWFVRAVRRERPDAIHAHDTAMLVPGWLAARRAGARLVYDTHEYAPGVPYRERLWAWSVNLVERGLIRRCDAVITVSDGIADRLRERYRLRERPTVVRNVADPDAYDPAFEAPDLRTLLDVAPGAPLVLHLGALARDRGCEQLVRAMARLDEPAQLLFLGADDEAYVERLRAVARAAGQSERVHFLPSVPIAHVSAHVRQASVGVSLLEDTCENHRLALPNKVFEYVAAGLPVVVSDLPELRRLIDEHGIGWVVDGGDPEALVGTLRRALAERTSTELTARLAKAGRSLSWANEAEGVARAYGERKSSVGLDGLRALVLVRNPCTHDARVLREARLLADRGAVARVVGVVSTAEPQRSGVVDGVAVERLAPTSPLARLRASGKSMPVGRGAAPASAGTPGEPSAKPGAGRRLHRWLVTLDYYRLGIRMVSRSRPDLVHCNDYNTMWIGVAARVRGSAVVYDAHELWPDRNLRPEPRWWLMLCEALFVRVADVVTTTSPGYAAVMARRYRIPAPRVVRNVPDVGLLPSRSRARAPRGVRRAVYFGALTPGRGLEPTIRALPLVPELELRLVGPDAWGYRSRLAGLVRELGLSDRVELLGPVAPSRALDVLADGDVGLALIEPACLSYRLTLPNKLFEYVSAGLPILASDLPVIADFVVSTGTGLTVDPTDGEAIAEGLAAVLDPRCNERLRKASRETAGSLTWRREQELLLDAYRQAAARGGRAAS
ncbi:MAG: glycosyltransferase [Egibacteraceae bacterium]